MNTNGRQREARRIAVRHYLEQFWIDKKFSLSSIILASIGNIFVFYIPPLILGKFLQRYSSQPLPQLSDLTPYLLAFAGLWLLGEVFWRFARRMIIITEVNGMERLYKNGVSNLLKKELSFFHENFAGSLTKKTIGYARSYDAICEAFIHDMMANLLPLIFVCYVLWQFSPILPIGLIVWLLLVTLLILPFVKHRRKLVAIRESSSNKLSGYIADIYTNIDAVRTYGREHFELSQHKYYTNDLLKKSKISWDYNNEKIATIIAPIYVLTNVFGFVIAITLAKKTGASIETVLVTFSYYAIFTRIMWEFNSIYRMIETGISEAAQYTELLLDNPKVNDAKKPAPFKIKSGQLEFHDVTFHYKDNETTELFENLNLYVKNGEKVGLVGHSGGGKSTLVKLILRLMDIDKGQILIDGQDISRIKQVELREYIGYVPQDPVMFHRSIKENILYGKLTAEKKEIIKAAQDSHSTEFIQQMPDQYETLIGERGVKLSGGQRQRIAIARAMLKNAPILLLDEATSALDSESEKLIQDALWKLMEDKTAIVIAHRLSTIQRMDRIVVLEEGKIVEEGSHKELLAKKGIYAELWKHQSGGFLEE
ncbi:MAG TPA: ABC transporter ATP-binding protein [Patescibacteria group bacterium]|nr:ABC transporter ATP-binding protein [Patescibacteria group bacterium]